MGLGGGEDIERLMKKVHSLVIGLRTDDFSFIHDMVQLAVERDITLHILDLGEESDHHFDCLVIDKESEKPGNELHFDHCITMEDTPTGTLEKAISTSLDRGSPKNVP
jgi:hypothetical protein